MQKVKFSQISGRLLASLSVLIAACAAFWLVPPAAVAAPKIDDYEKIRESVVRVHTTRYSGGSWRSGTGTGWIIEAADSENNAGLGTVVTAAHVVRGARKIYITQDGSDERLAVEVKAVDRDRDIAILEVKDLVGQPLKISQQIPKLGMTLRTLGFTQASDDLDENNKARTASLKSGTFSKAGRGAKSLDYFEHDIVVNPGYSGGPVLDDCGRVVGLIVSGYGIRGPNGAFISTAQGIGNAIAANEIVKVASDENVEIQRDDSECGEVAKAPEVTAASDEPRPTEGSTPADQTNESEGLSSNQMIAVAVVVLGLLGAIIAGVLLLRRKPASVSQTTFENPNKQSPTSAVIGGSGSATSAALSGNASTQSTSSILLEGNIPEGGQVSIEFTSDDLGGDGVFLGADSSAVRGVINDTRANRLVSRMHAKLTSSGQDYTIMDNRATNGTFIGGKKLEPLKPHPLKTGDTIKLADVELRVTIR